MARPPTGKRKTTNDGAVSVAGKLPNGSGSVYFVQTAGCWRATYLDESTGKRRTVSAPSRQAAVERQAAALARSRKPTVGSDMTVADLASWWHANALGPDVRPSSRAEYLKRVERITVTPLGQVRVTAARLAHLRAWQTEALKRYSRQTVGSDRVALRMMFTEAVASDVIAVNPVRDLTGGRIPKRRRRVLTPDEVQALITAAADEQYGAAVPLLFICGMRVSELLGLAWDDIDLDEATATVARASIYIGGAGQALGPTKSDGAMGVYHLPRSAVDLLRQRYARQLGQRDLYPDAREWRYEGRVVDLVFTTPTGGLVLRQSIAKTLQRCARTAGISTEDLATHTGRRTLVSTLEAAGVARALVSDAVGHSDQATTETYVHRDRTRSREVSAIAAGLLDPKPPGDT